MSDSRIEHGPDERKNFRLRYVGPRFVGPRLPVEVLSDLPAFRDLMVSFAKSEWRKRNSSRKRVPKGFDSSFAMDLVALEDGSAIPKIQWNRDTAQAALPGFSDELEEIVASSYLEISQLVDDSGNNKFPKSLPTEHVRALNKLGASLLDGERIEFLGTTGADGNVIYLDTYRRKKIITHVRETYQARYKSVGTLVGLLVEDSINGFIIVRTEEHDDVKIPLDSEIIKADFDGNIEADVQLDLLIELDNDDKLRSIIEVYDADIVDEEIESAITTELTRCRDRLQHLQNLEDGWHNGAGQKISGAASELANTFLSKRPSLAQVYRIYPTEAGGILFEFEVSGWDLSVEFTSDKSVEIYGVELDGTGELEPELFQEIDGKFLDLLDKYTEQRK